MKNKLLILLTLKAIVMIGIILFSGIDLNPEEAQYWTWSQNPSWGYYSKPPGIAWEIWTGCQLLGNTEIGIRIGAVFLAFLTAFTIYHLALACQLKEKTAFFSAIIMAVSPIGVMGSFLTVTDVGMILFWTIACFVMVQSHFKPNPYLLGFVIFCGALFKWPIYFFWIFALPFYPKPKIILAITVSLFGLLPSIYWNATNQWVTFRHVAATLLGKHQTDIGATYVKQGNFLDFIGAQAGLLSPLLFIFFFIGFSSFIWKYLKLLKFSKLQLSTAEVYATDPFSNKKEIQYVTNRALLFCASITFTTLIIYSTLSYFQKMQGNWCVFAYPTAIVFLSWFLIEATSWGKIGLYICIFTAILQNLLLYSVPILQKNNLASIPYSLNIFRHSMGWNELKKIITDLNYNPETEFLFSNKYQMSSILSFYSPSQKRAYFLNMQNHRQNQFSFWPSMKKEQLGKTGYFILAENNPHLKRWNENTVIQYSKQLEKFFERVECLGIYPLFISNGKTEKSVLIFKCFIYNGQEPKEVLSY